MTISGRPFIPMCGVFLYFLFCCTASFADGISVEAPKSVGIGQPFRAIITAPSQVSVKWNGSLVQAYDMGDGTWSALLATDLKNTKPGSATLEVRTDSGVAATVSVALTAMSYPREDLKVAGKMVNPPKEEMARIEKEAKAARAALRRNVPPVSAMTEKWVRPVPGDVSTPYGKSRYFNGQFKGRHSGVDFRAASGTPVKSVAGGSVVLAGNLFFAGMSVYVDHGGGIVTAYLHMSEIKVKNGDTVKAGQVVGLSGATGRVTGPHLHFSSAYMGQFFDPMSMF